MSKPRSKVLGLLLGATMGLVGFASASAPAVANDAVGDAKFYLLCLQKLMTNAADRVPVCNPVLQDFKLQRNDTGPAPKKEEPPPVDECDVQPTAFVLSDYNHDDPCDDDECETNYHHAAWTLAGYQHDNCHQGPPPCYQAGSWNGAFDANALLLQVGGRGNDHCYDPCNGRSMRSSWGWDYNTDEFGLIQVAGKGKPNLFQQFNNNNKNFFQQPQKKNNNKFQQNNNNKNKFQQNNKNGKKGKKGRGNYGGHGGNNCNAASTPLTLQPLVMLNI